MEVQPPDQTDRPHGCHPTYVRTPTLAILHLQSQRYHKSLLSDSLPSTDGKDLSPSNSPAKKKSKPSSPEQPKGSLELGQSSHQKKSKKRFTSSTPASVLKPSKYASSSGKSKEASNPSPPHVHNHRNVLLDISIDFTKESLSQFEGDIGKKMVFAIQQFLINLKISDKLATINPIDTLSGGPPLGGRSSTPVPTNMMALSNYIKGLNPRAFQTNRRTSQDPQDLTHGPTRRTSALAYGVISISCDKDPELLVNQISYE
jgi:hypothetical protein